MFDDSVASGSLQRDGIVADRRSRDWPVLQDVLAGIDRLQRDQASRDICRLRGGDDPRNIKPYISKWLGYLPVYDRDSPLAVLARQLSPLVEAYCGEPCRLRYYNIWHTSVIAEAPTVSQVWHRDTEDTRIVKAFLYATDVLELGAGPFQYVRGSQQGGAWTGQPETYVTDGALQLRRVTDAAMDAATDGEQVIAYGPRGTLVIADTAGYHKGGYCTTQPRLMATWMWTTVKGGYPSLFHDHVEPS